MPGLLSGEGREERRGKKETGGKRKDGRGRRDANVFVSRRSQRGESVQKASLSLSLSVRLSRRQVITRKVRAKAEFKVEVNYLAGI